MSCKKNQASLEFIIIFGMAVAVIVFLGALFLGFFNTEKKNFDNEHIKNIGQQITDNIVRVYFLGIGNRLTMDVDFPEGIKSITIHHMNVSDPVNPGDRLYYDYINFSMYNEKAVVSSIFYPDETYIRFNCTKYCSFDPLTNISIYNDSITSSGHKRIRFDSKGDWVAVDFVVE